ncbi:hypothetical protein Tco_0723565 [Tanacetum coccineum]
MSQDQSIPSRNKVDWHMANDDPIFTTMRFIPQHEVVQKYDAILPDNLTTQAMKESKAYKTYYAFAIRKAIPKPKYVRRTTKEKIVQAPKASSGKRIKSATKPSKEAKHNFTALNPAVQKSSDEEDDDDEANIGKDEDDDDQDDDDNADYDDDDDDERTKSDNDGDDFVHPKFSTHDEEDKEEDSFDPRVQTPSHVESTDDEDSDEEIQGRDIEMTNAQQTNVQPTQVTEDTHVIITAPVNPEDVPVTAIAEPPLLSVTTTPPPPTPLNTSCITNTKISRIPIKEQVKAQVFKILLKIEKTVNEQLEAEILTCSSNESKTSHAIAANLSELELKKILIDKMESNKLIYRSNEQKNLYKALMMRIREKTSVDQKPGVQEEEEHRIRIESTSAPKEKTSKTTGKSTEGSKSHHKSAGKSAQAEEPMHTAKDLEEPAHQEFKTGPLPLIPNSHGRQVIPFDHFIKNDLAYLCGGVSSRTYATSITKTKAADYGHIKWIEELVPNIMWSQITVNYNKYALYGISHWGRKHQQFYGFAANRESAHDVYYKRRIIAVTKLQIVEWHGYKHLDWITIHREDDKLYTFKEGDFKRLRLQDIEDMLIFLVQGKLTNLNVE